MTVQTYNSVKQGMVQDMRSIREQISLEIKEMTFEQERAYLDKLLSEKKKPMPHTGLAQESTDE